MNHDTLQHLVGQQLDGEDLAVYAAADLAVSISRTSAMMSRGDRVLFLVKLQQHLGRLILLGPDRVADADRVAQLLGLVQR